ncbi:MAG: YwaF family protein [Clostridia bacterium]|nr:YwaF family protein [Clostridia bacterium]
MLWKEILAFLEAEMVTPKPYGAFHLLWLGLTIAVIIFLCFVRKKHNEKVLKCVLGIYGVTAFILEALKQLIWSVDYSEELGKFIWDYQWYAAPFQLCTMPIYICLMCLFLNKGKIRDALLAFVAYTTILGSIASAIIPDQLFVPEILINIHTMFLHLGSLVVSIYLLMSGEVKIDIKSLLMGLVVFLIVVVIANTLNIVVYNSGILNGETFNMLYISPYLESTLPVFDSIYNNVQYIAFLMLYIVALSLGSYIIYAVAKGIDRLNNK